MEARGRRGRAETGDLRPEGGDLRGRAEICGVWISEALEQILCCGDQPWIVDSRGIPDDGVLGSKVAVRQNITESSDSAPRNLRKSLREFDGQLLHGLANNLKVPGDRINRPTVRDKGIVVKSAKVALDGLGCLQNILQAEDRITRHGGDQVGCAAGSGPGTFFCCADQRTRRAAPREKT